MNSRWASAAAEKALTFVGVRVRDDRHLCTPLPLSKMWVWIASFNSSTAMGANMPVLTLFQNNTLQFCKLFRVKSDKGKDLHVLQNCYLHSESKPKPFFFLSIGAVRELISKYRIYRTSGAFLYKANEFGRVAKAECVSSVYPLLAVPSPFHPALTGSSTSSLSCSRALPLWGKEKKLQLVAPPFIYYDTAVYISG